jgi:hypothetical protein
MGVIMVCKPTNITGRLHPVCLVKHQLKSRNRSTYPKRSLVLSDLKILPKHIAANTYCDVVYIHLHNTVYILVAVYEHIILYHLYI